MALTELKRLSGIILITGWGELQGCDMLRISLCLDNWLTGGCSVYIYIFIDIYIHLLATNIWLMRFLNI
jgi:hypothetical protein